MADMRREKGSGSVRPDTSRPGKWKGNTWTGQWVGSVQVNGQRYYARGRTRTDVLAKLAQHQADARTSNGRPKADGRKTVGDVIDLYLERELPSLTGHAGGPLAPRTIESYRWAGDTIKAEIGSVRLAKLTPDRIEQMLDKLSGRQPNPLGKSSLSKILNKLTQFLDLAVRREYVHRNAAEHAKLTPTATPPAERRALSPDAARKLLAALREPYVDEAGDTQIERNGVMFALCLRLGLRPGEAAAPWWDDVDLDAATPTINVTRGVRLVRGTATISDDLKTVSSKRTLALPHDLADWLYEHRHSQITERLAAPRWHDDRLVFATPTGHVLDPKAVRTQLAAVCKRADVPKIAPNELRHSCASLLADEGVPHELIADLLGHVDTRMVQRTYKHRLRPVVDVAARATWAQTS